MVVNTVGHLARGSGGPLASPSHVDLNSIHSQVVLCHKMRAHGLKNIESGDVASVIVAINSQEGRGEEGICSWPPAPSLPSSRPSARDFSPVWSDGS
jgi:hypothetical protein